MSKFLFGDIFLFLHFSKDAIEQGNAVVIIPFRAGNPKIKGFLKLKVKIMSNATKEKKKISLFDIDI